MGLLNVLKVSDIKGGSKIILDFDRKSLAIPDSQINQVVKTVEIEKVEIDLEEKQKRELQDLFNSFQGLFSDKPGLTHVLYHEIDTGDNPPVVSRPYRYDRVKQEILDYHVDKMLKEGTIIPIQSPYASPVVLCRKNNGLPPDNPKAYRFAVDNRKLNAITKYPRYPLPVIDDLMMNIPHTGIMSALDLRSGYFQMGVNPSDIVKIAFVTKNGTYAFRRMSFGLSGAAPNFQKAIIIILKPVIGKFVNVYMDDVIISSPSFTQHVKHLEEVFRLLHEAGLTLNKDKCKFCCEELKYLGLIINKEGIKIDETKVQAIVEMKPPRNSKEVSNFLGMSQWLVEGLLFYAKYATSLEEMRVYIPKSLSNEIMREFHDKPLAGHFGRFKTYHKIRDVCYFPYMRKFIDQYFSTCHMCQINNYKNALPAGRLIPIVSNYPNEIVTLDLLGPYTVSRVRRNRYVLVITDRFSKWAEIIPLKKASARVIADNFFDNYILRFGAPIKLISDNGPQFISDIFEKLSERLGIGHVKTVVYRPQANRTERVNRDRVQMIANYVNEQHDTWDQFLREFAYAIRTAVNETTGKTPAELFLGRKLITPFQKLVMVRIYRHRKCDETEIRTGNSDNGSLRDESSCFDRVQRRSNESQDGKKKRSEVKRELEEKGLSFRNNKGEKHTNKTNKRGPLIRSIPSSWSEKGRMIKKNKNERLGYKRSNESRSGGPERIVQKGSEHRVNKRGLSSNDSNSVLPRLRKKNRREETVTPTTSGYNLRPRKGKREQSRLIIERKTQQGGPIRSRKGRERNYSPYIEERTRSSNKNARRGGDQQRQDQERRGTCTKKSLSLEILAGNANYKP
ncbi:retrovirus-related Pol polyprotein from transposon 297 [Trichonephila clavipes]|uniref:RNA-directed DNA polymerase n=1 Tax=Trichonephila clavipes TaxID=2585209 RepID=A0A8X6WB82_TRICX|nr:retrovirus-related Pol polyprotein from transposon 297 [Trichonephila clavipes]